LKSEIHYRALIFFVIKNDSPSKLYYPGRFPPYFGVGRVTEKAKSITDFKRKPIPS